MKLQTTLFLSILATLTTAAPTTPSIHSPANETAQNTTAANSNENAAETWCPPGGYKCGDSWEVPGAVGDCYQCVIQVGDAGGVCRVAAYCAFRGGSCNYSDGQPYCF